MGTNRRKINPDVFTDSVGARELKANARRESLSYDAYGAQLDFDVVVLAKPIPLNGNDATLIFGTAANQGPNTGQSGMVEGSIAFKGRIVGGPYLSPHLPLPDPCNLPEATDQAAAAKIIAMHTTFISTQGSIQQGAFPQVGDRVRVSLLPGDYKFNLQYAYFNKITNSSEGASAASAMSGDCTTLKGLFSGFDPTTDLGTLSIALSASYAPTAAAPTAASAVTRRAPGPAGTPSTIGAATAANPKLVYFYPGIGYGTKPHVEKVIASMSIPSSVIIILADNASAPFSSLEAASKTALAGKTPSAIKLGGWSGGARGVSTVMVPGKSFNTVIYADPEPHTLIGKTHTNAKMYYNPSNWGDTSIRSKLGELATEMGPKAQLVTGTHDEILKKVLKELIS